MKFKEIVAEKLSEVENKEYTSRLPVTFHNSALFRNGAYESLLIFEGSGNALASVATRDSISEIAVWASSKNVLKSDYPYIKQWFTTALENNKYETIIALRQIYKKDMYFHDKNVERYLKALCQEAISTQ